MLLRLRTWPLEKPNALECLKNQVLIFTLIEPMNFGLGTGQRQHRNGIIILLSRDDCKKWDNLGSGLNLSICIAFVKKTNMVVVSIRCMYSVSQTRWIEASAWLSMGEIAFCRHTNWITTPVQYRLYIVIILTKQYYLLRMYPVEDQLAALRYIKFLL